MRIKAALALLAVAACGAGPATPGGPEIVSIPVAAEVRAGPLRYVGGVELRGGGPLFGGFSSLEVSADGSRFIAVSDKAVWMEGTLRREGGRLVGAEVARIAPLEGPEGGRGWFAERDAEGLAVDGAALEGARFVSFERWHRVSRFADGAAREVELARPASWRKMPVNNGVEALAAAPSGDLLGIRESWSPPKTIPAFWIGRDGTVRDAVLPRMQGATPTGADFGPDGRLYVVERSFDFPAGFRFRLRRFEVAGGAIGPVELLLDLGDFSAADNGEGVAVWRDEAGDIRIDVITDDNFNLLQRTLIVEFALPADPAG